MAETSPQAADLLLVRLSSFGDVVLTEPIARALKRHYSESRLLFVTGSGYAGIPALFPSVDEVIPYSKTGANPEFEEAASSADVKVVVDLQNSLRSRRLTGRFGAPRTVRFGRQRLRRFLLVHMPRVWKGSLKHTVEKYAEPLGALGIVPENLEPAVKVSGSGIRAAETTFGRGPFVALCPGGSSKHKRWSERQFAELAGILARSGLSVLIVGAEGDRPVIHKILARLGGSEPQVCIGNDVAATAAALSLCDVTVSNDSGLMHLAAAAGSRVVAIYGPTSPLLGFSPKSAGCVVASLNLPCSPCSYHGNKPCKYGHRRCLEDMEPGYVARMVGEIAGMNENDRNHEGSQLRS
jgi:heptosyltransferase-2